MSGGVQRTQGWGGPAPGDIVPRDRVTVCDGPGVDHPYVRVPEGTHWRDIQAALGERYWIPPGSARSASAWPRLFTVRLFPRDATTKGVRRPDDSIARGPIPLSPETRFYRVRTAARYRAAGVAGLLERKVVESLPKLAYEIHVQGWRILCEAQHGTRLESPDYDPAGYRSRGCRIRVDRGCCVDGVYYPTEPGVPLEVWRSAVCIGVWYAGQPQREIKRFMG